MTVEVDGLSKNEQQVLLDILNDARLSAERLRLAAVKWMELPEGSRAKIVTGSPVSLRAFWARLTRVGMGSLHPQLSLVGGKAATLLGKLPLVEQERYLRDRMPLVVRKGRGFDVRLMDVAELSEEQRKQVFRVADDGSVVVRDEEEQKVYFSRKAAALLVQAAQLDGLKTVVRAGWKVERGRVWVREEKAAAGLTEKDLLMMMRDLRE